MIDFTTTVLRPLACVAAALLITFVAGTSFVHATATVPAQAPAAVTVSA